MISMFHKTKSDNVLSNDTTCSGKQSEYFIWSSTADVTDMEQPRVLTRNASSALTTQRHSPSFLRPDSYSVAAPSGADVRQNTGNISCDAALFILKEELQVIKPL